MKKMLVFRPDNRMSAGKALLHPYFSDFGFTPMSTSPTSEIASSEASTSMSEAGSSSEANTSLSPVNTVDSGSTSFSSHETSGDSLGDMSSTTDNQS